MTVLNSLYGPHPIMLTSPFVSLATTPPTHSFEGSDVGNGDRLRSG